MLEMIGIMEELQLILSRQLIGRWMLVLYVVDPAKTTYCGQSDKVGSSTGWDDQSEL
jgi:hypothetical protein